MSTFRRTRRFLIGAVAIAGALLALPAAAQTSADVKLEATGTVPEKITYGQSKTFKYLVTNLGPSAGTGLEITDISVPAEFEYSISGCTPLEDNDPGELVPCTIGDGVIYDEPDIAHPVNQQAFSITVTLPSQDADGNFIYPATCTAGDVFDDLVVTIGADNDPDDGNNTVEAPGLETTTFGDLSVALEAPATANIGDLIEVGVVVTNHGPCDADKVAANDFTNFYTSMTLGFEGAVGDCTNDIQGADDSDGCEWDTVAAGESKSWTITYKVLDLPAGLMQTGDPVLVDVYSDGDFTDLDSSNDEAVTQTIVKKSQSGCSTGDLGGALGLLLVAVPFLRRRRKS